MRNPVHDMLDKYGAKTPEAYRNALKEIIQAIALCGLSRAGFFGQASFYGGTALRMFHQLDRFSEDLDFSLDKPDPGFRLETFLPAVQDELGAYGFVMSVERTLKAHESAVQSAFIKGGTLVHLLCIAEMEPPISGVLSNAQWKVKLEIDTDPPLGSTTEVKYQLLPIPHSVRLHDLPSLYAGKLHALLARSWGQHIKGRDFYDYLWDLAHDIRVNLVHLEARLRQSGHWTSQESLSSDALLTLLLERLGTIDYKQAAEDVRPFIPDTRGLDLWSADFFQAMTREHLHWI